MRVAISGVTGFVGSNLAVALLKQNVFVVGLSRRKSPISDRRFKSCIVDYSDTPALASAMAGCDVLIHLAGLAHDKGLLKDSAGYTHYHKSNVLTSASLARACQEAHVRRFVFASSISVYGSAPKSEIALITDNSPLSPENWYGISKLIAEDFIESILIGSSVEYVVVRLPLVLSATSPGNLASLLNLFAFTKINIFSALGQKKAYISLGSLVDVLSFCCASDGLNGLRLIAADLGFVSIASLASLYYSNVPRNILRLSLLVPSWLFRIVLTMAGRGNVWSKLDQEILVQCSPCLRHLAKPFSRAMFTAG